MKKLLVVMAGSDAEPTSNIADQTYGTKRSNSVANGVANRRSEENRPRQRTISPQNHRRGGAAVPGDTNDTLTSPIVTHEVCLPKHLTDDHPTKKTHTKDQKLNLDVQGELLREAGDLKF